MVKKNRTELAPINNHEEFLGYMRQFTKPGAPITENIKNVEDHAKTLLKCAAIAKKQHAAIRLKYVLEQLGTECFQVMKECIGLTESKTFQRAINELIELGKVRQVGLDDTTARNKKRIYDLTGFLLKTRVYYMNIENTSYTDICYEGHIDQELKDYVGSKKKGFAELIRQARIEEARLARKDIERGFSKKDKWLRAAIELKKNFNSHILGFDRIKDFLSTRKNILPYSDERYKSYFQILVDEKVLIKKIEKGKRGFIVNPDWQIPEVA